MPEERHKTVLEIAVDDSKIRQLGPTIEKSLKTEPVERLIRVTERLNAALERVNRTSAQRREPAGGAVGAGTYRGADGRLRDVDTGRFIAGGGGRGGGGAPGAGGGGRRGMGFWGQAAATGVGVAGAGMFGRAMGMGRAAAGGQGATETALSAIPLAGPILAAGVQAGRQIGQAAIAYRQVTAQQFGRAGISGLGPGQGLAQRVGIGMPELAGQMGALAPVAGMRGRAAQEFIPRALAIERFSGIGAREQAAVVGGARVAGQAATGTEATRMVFSTISAAIKAGYREGKEGEFLSEIAEHVGALRKQGFMMDLGTMNRFAATLGTAGGALRGEAGMQAAKSIQQVVAQAPFKNTFFSAMFMSEAAKQGLSPIEAMKAAETGEGLKKVLPAVITRIARGQGGMGGKIMALRAGLEGKLSIEQIEGLLGLAGRGALTEGAMANVLEGGAIGAAEIGKRRGVVEPGMGLAARKAGIEAQRIGAGLKKGVAGQVLDIEEKELQLGIVGAEFGLRAAGTMLKKFDEYVAAWKKGGLGEVVKTAFADMGDIIGKAILDGIRQIMKEVLPKVPIPELNPEKIGEELADMNKEDAWAGAKLFMADFQKFGAWYGALQTKPFKMLMDPESPINKRMREVDPLAYEVGENSPGVLLTRKIGELITALNQRFEAE